MMRTERTKLTFPRAFHLKGVDQPLPPGEYEIISDQELIEGLSFPVYRRTASWIMAPTATSAMEMLPVDPEDLAAAQARDLVPRP